MNSNVSNSILQNTTTARHRKCSSQVLINTGAGGLHAKPTHCDSKFSTGTNAAPLPPHFEQVDAQARCSLQTADVALAATGALLTNAFIAIPP